MNYAMWISCRVEERLAQVNRHGSWSQYDEAAAYTVALNDVIREDEGRTWADGNIRIGDYILLVDSDTRVPEDCLLDAVSEMSEDFDEILYELEADEGADEELIQAALAIEALWSELSLACLNKVRILRGMPPITISMTGSDEDGEEP